MDKKIICIECPLSCELTLDIENCRVVKVSGNKCPKGELYAKSEVENPVRILTSAVYGEGLNLKMIPVRTKGPIPKSRIFDGMQEIKKIVVKKPVETGDIIVSNFLGLGTDLIVTRDAFK